MIRSIRYQVPFERAWQQKSQRNEIWCHHMIQEARYFGNGSITAQRLGQRRQDPRKSLRLPRVRLFQYLPSFSYRKERSIKQPEPQQPRGKQQEPRITSHCQ